MGFIEQLDLELSEATRTWKMWFVHVESFVIPDSLAGTHFPSFSSVWQDPKDTCSS